MQSSGEIRCRGKYSFVGAASISSSFTSLDWEPYTAGGTSCACFTTVPSQCRSKTLACGSSWMTPWLKCPRSKLPWTTEGE